LRRRGDRRAAAAAAARGERLARWSGGETRGRAVGDASIDAFDR